MKTLIRALLAAALLFLPETGNTQNVLLNGSGHPVLIANKPATTACTAMGPTGLGLTSCNLMLNETFPNSLFWGGTSGTGPGSIIANNSNSSNANYSSILPFATPYNRQDQSNIVYSDGGLAFSDSVIRDPVTLSTPGLADLHSDSSMGGYAVSWTKAGFYGANLNSSPSFYSDYGYYEINAQMDNHPGMWPLFYLYPYSDLFLKFNGFVTPGTSVLNVTNVILGKWFGQHNTGGGNYRVFCPTCSSPPSGLWTTAQLTSTEPGGALGGRGTYQLNFTISAGYPAGSTFTSSNPNSVTSELDFYEGVGGTPASLYTTTHDNMPTGSSCPNFSKCAAYSTTSTNFSSGFHKMGFNVTPTTITRYIDDVLYDSIGYPTNFQGVVWYYNIGVDMDNCLTAGVYNASFSTNQMTVNSAVSGYTLGYNSVISGINATGTATGSGTNLTLSGVANYVNIGGTVTGTGIPGSTTIVSQTSGTTGSNGVYVTSAATTIAGTTATITTPMPFGTVITSKVGGGSPPWTTGVFNLSTTPGTLASQNVGTGGNGVCAWGGAANGNGPPSGYPNDYKIKSIRVYNNGYTTNAGGWVSVAGSQVGPQYP